MTFHDVKFCRGVAMVLQGESMKAASYVSHGTSLGTLREKIVRDFIRHETPDRLRVETGFIRNHATNDISRQCDLLIHEPWEMPPQYRFDDFVIVHPPTARAVIEVKSDLDGDDFLDLLKVHASVTELALKSTSRLVIPTFGFGLEGVTFESLTCYLQQAVISDRLGCKAARLPLSVNWPDCIAIQARNLIGVRPNPGFWNS